MSKDIVGFSVVDSLAYIVVSSVGLEIIDISDPTSIRLLSTTKNDMLGDVDVVGNRAYALTCSVGKGHSHLAVIDVSDPRAAFISHDQGSHDPSIRRFGSWGRDIVATGTLAVVPWEVRSGLYSGISVFDISNPDAPSLMSEYRLSRNRIHLKGFAVCGSLAYVSWSKRYREKITGLSAIDISDPASPVLRAEILLPGEVSLRGSLAVSGSYAYVTSGKDCLQIVNISPLGNK